MVWEEGVGGQGSRSQTSGSHVTHSLYVLRTVLSCCTVPARSAVNECSMSGNVSVTFAGRAFPYVRSWRIPWLGALLNSGTNRWGKEDWTVDRVPAELACVNANSRRVSSQRCPRRSHSNFGGSGLPTEESRFFLNMLRRGK